MLCVKVNHPLSVMVWDLAPFFSTWTTSRRLGSWNIVSLRWARSTPPLGHGPLLRSIRGLTNGNLPKVEQAMKQYAAFLVFLSDIPCLHTLSKTSQFAAGGRLRTWECRKLGNTAKLTNPNDAMHGVNISAKATFSLFRGRNGKSLNIQLPSKGSHRECKDK